MMRKDFPYVVKNGVAVLNTKADSELPTSTTLVLERPVKVFSLQRQVLKPLICIHGIPLGAM